MEVATRSSWILFLPGLGTNDENGSAGTAGRGGTSDEQLSLVGIGVEAQGRPLDLLGPRMSGSGITLEEAAAADAESTTINQADISSSPATRLNPRGQSEEGEWGLRHTRAHRQVTE